MHECVCWNSCCPPPDQTLPKWPTPHERLNRPDLKPRLYVGSICCQFEPCWHSMNTDVSDGFVHIHWVISLCVLISWTLLSHFLPILFVGALAKLRKATISFVMYVCLSVRMEQGCSHWTDFNEIWYLNIFRKSVEKVRVALKRDKNCAYFTWKPIYIIYHMSLISS